MKILMAVVSDLRSDARVRREAAVLAADGHDVRVVGFDSGVRRAGSTVEEGVRYDVVPFPSRNLPRPLRLARAGLGAVRAALVMSRGRADAVHCHNLHLSLPALFVARRQGAALVYDAHELEACKHRGPVRRLIERWERLVWRRSQARITTNPSRAEYLERLHGSRPAVVGNYPRTPGPGMEPKDLRARLGIPGERLVLIFQGGFYLESRCFRTVATALRGLPEWHWVLIGFGSDDTVRKLRELIAECGIEDRTTILPAVSVDELLSYTAGADVGVVPLTNSGLNCYLGDTNKLFEYLMAGLAVVGSDFPEVRRAVLEGPAGPTGVLFDPASSASVVRALREAAAGLSMFRRNAVNARAAYSWETESRTLTHLYRALAAPQGAEPATEQGRQAEPSGLPKGA
ncbi:glycosyltransferase [Streptomyces gibsoniae]|uniref:D-inositol 3-phosphate glycosyltransferase n=1 Tax=Streptomyces gibsoniae TaxID=3075529 RepID=A0ABU2TVP8_9ACTN|nr:glycosyltransferase [Streptomyces sp. DSM 41699]MDT0465047.1 glycosyltransferase [Streptomyces sp. DSM 41699]